MAENPHIPPPSDRRAPASGPSSTTPPPADQTAPPPPRKKGHDILKWTLLVLLLLIVGGAVLLYINLNRIVRAQVEKQSAAQLNVPTSLGGANVSLFGGSVSLSDFNVGSPAGFNAERMLSLGEVNVEAKITELNDDPVRVQTIDIVRPRMTIEMQGTQFNVKKFIDQLPPGEPKPADEEKPLKLVIGNLKVTGAEVVFRPDPSALSAIPGLNPDSINLKDEYILTLPNIELKNVGTGEGAENGAAIKEVVTLLVTSMAAKAAESEQLPPELRSLLSGDVEEMINLAKAKIGEELNKQVDEIKADLKEKIGEELGDQVGEILSDPNKLKEDPGKAIKEGLGGLINRKKGSPATQPK
ncbi:MAG TPA: hypothetical protein VGR35_19110 [Tepidisphaeraceae bacterium]|nr:hypothetical protein [Tepidisphaeraceae bacterium]